MAQVLANRTDTGILQPKWSASDLGPDDFASEIAIIKDTAVSQGIWGVGASEGQQYLAFNSSNMNGAGAINCSFPVVAGQAYEVSFSIGRGGPGSDPSVMRVDALDVHFYGPGVLWEEAFSIDTVGWTTFRRAVVPNTSQLMLSFQDISLFTESSVGIGVDVLLDNVLVTAVPEPELVAGISGVALAGFAVARRLKGPRNPL